jgi:hypothetical protein
MLSYTHNVGPSSFTNSVCLPVSMPSLAATTTLPSHKDSRTRSDQTSCQMSEERLQLLGGAHRHCYHLGWSWGSGQVRGICWLLRLVRILPFLPFSRVFTKCADNYVGFVAYAMSNQPCCITRRVRTRESRRRMFSAWLLLRMPLFRHPRVRKLIFVDLPVLTCPL